MNDIYTCLLYTSKMKGYNKNIKPTTAENVLKLSLIHIYRSLR